MSDFGSTACGPTLSTEQWTWAFTNNGTLPELNIDKVFDGSGSLAAETAYGYDGSSVTPTSGLPQHVAVTGYRGNPTQIDQYIDSADYLQTTLTFEDTGDALSAISPTGQSSFGYDTATHAFTTTSTPPTPSSGVSLPTSFGYDVSNSGLLLNTTDPNNALTSYKYDSMLRLSEVDYPDGGHTNIGYDNANQTSISQYQSSSTAADTENLLDSYGRQSRVAQSNGQSSNPWYQQDTCFDANGNLLFQSYRYQGNGWGTTKACSSSQSAGDAYTYDALGRVLTVIHGDSTTVHYTYTGRATKVVDEKGFVRVSQVDGLGRLTYVCEVTSTTMQSSGSPAACGLDIPATGYLTTYAYSLSTHSTTLTQGSQIRTFRPIGSVALQRFRNRNPDRLHTVIRITPLVCR